MVFEAILNFCEERTAMGTQNIVFKQESLSNSRNIKLLFKNPFHCIFFNVCFPQLIFAGHLNQEHCTLSSPPKNSFDLYSCYNLFLFVLSQGRIQYGTNILLILLFSLRIPQTGLLFNFQRRMRLIFFLNLTAIVSHVIYSYIINKK